MKKNLLALSLAAILTAGSTASMAAVEDSFDVGVRGGWAFTNFSDTSYTSSDDDNGYGVGIYFGYNVKSWFGVEFGYNYFDDFGVKGKNGDNTYTTDFSLQGPELALRFAYPLTDDGSDIFLRAGAMYVIADNDIESGHEDRIAPLLGAGVQYAFTKNFGVRVGFDYYFNVYDPDSEVYSDTDLGLVYAALQLTFGGDKPALAPEPAPAPQHVTKTFALQAGALFPFDGSQLSEEGSEAIADVVHQVNAANVTNATYTVTGYTDRLGSEAYNQRLSEARAQAAADGLVTSGVAPHQIVSVEGKGPANPVTGSECDGLARKDLIKCLAPDRRVEISVDGEIDVVE